MATTAGMRKELRRLIDVLPDADLPTAERVLRGILATTEEHPAIRALRNAPAGEPLTSDEFEALQEADVEENAGNPPLSHAEVKRRLGMR